MAGAMRRMDGATSRLHSGNSAEGFPAMRDWEQCYRDGETPWDKGSPAPPLLELIERHGVELWGGGPVLVPGCGLGHNVRALAANGIPALGLDISPTAVEMAREQAAEGACYEVGDFLDPAWRVGRSFSAIWEHTCFCAIDPALRENYAQATAELLLPGGVFAAAFYLTPHNLGEDGAGPPFGASTHEIDALFSQWFERIAAWVPETAYPGREGREWLAVFRKLPHGRVAGQAGCR